MLIQCGPIHPKLSNLPQKYDPESDQCRVDQDLDKVCKRSQIPMNGSREYLSCITGMFEMKK